MDYQTRKNKVREEAIDWQTAFNELVMDWLTLANFLIEFEKLAKRYGLIKEFRENGII